MSWNPKTDYGVDEALKDILGESSVKDVCFTDSGVIKEYDSGKLTIFEEADNEKGHNSYDFEERDGHFYGTPHSNNS